MQTTSLADARRSEASLTTTETLMARWHDHEDREAREELFQRFLPLARKLAARYTNPHEPIEDLVQVASLGPAGRHRPVRPRPRGAVSGVRHPDHPRRAQALLPQHRLVGARARGAPRSWRCASTVPSVRSTSQSGPSSERRELAEYLELPQEDVLTGLDAGTAHYSVSLDAPSSAADDEEPDTLGDSLGDVDESYGLVETGMSLAAALGRLPYLERQALMLRLEKDLKQTEIARELGCSQMQVSRLLRRAAARLRDVTDPDVHREATSKAPVSLP